MYVQDNDRPDTILDSAISLSGVAKSFAVPPTEPRWFSGFQDTISATSVYLQHSLAEWTRINGFYWKLGPSQARSGPSSTLDQFAWASRAHIFCQLIGGMTKETSRSFATTLVELVRVLSRGGLRSRRSRLPYSIS